MKPIIVISTLASAALLTGCATSARPPLVLDPVGPEIHHAAPVTTTGTLMVYSAMDQFDTNGSDPLNEYAHYSDYEIWTPDGGKLLRRVHNHVLPFSDDEPVKVELEPGRYLVKASSNSFGRVRVPVIIAGHRLTTVHLEGGEAERDQSKSSPDKVYLPDGEVVGSRAPGQP